LFIADLPRKNQVIVNRITEQRRRLRAVRDLLAIGFRRQRRDIRIVEEQAPEVGLSSEAIIFSKVLFPQPEGPVISLNSPA
jgi:hypothetical protein